ncbi:MAG: DUF4445 domain-containing protein [Oscillospiraceae bacterium]|nr:DUF4445 domain-containing protein [Oscillospiraceae bacterium]
MGKLTVFRGKERFDLTFEGQPTVHSLLEQAGLAPSRPCGGAGRCGKCALRLEGAISPPDEQELFHGARLSCRARLLGNATAWLNSFSLAQIESAPLSDLPPLQPMAGALGMAVDIGTTTVVSRLYDLRSGRLLAQAQGENPQSRISSDVMGRISAAEAGDLSRLQEQILRCLEEQQNRCLALAGLQQRPESLVLTGNTTMLYLLTGRDPKCLARLPFQADCLFDLELPFGSAMAYLPPCISAFVGADISCALLAAGLCEKQETALFCDIGTNGEIALWRDGMLYVTATAAGPAFEGAGISCGCGSIPGAVCAVAVEQGEMRITTISDAPPVGLCGSGLLDALAIALSLGKIDETGAFTEGCEALPLCPDVVLQQEDIRAAQLAKAAIAAGIDTLLDHADLQPEQIDRFYISGGFGSRLNINSAVAIGLFPKALADRVEILGNAALSGACQTLLQGKSREKLRAIVQKAKAINLAADPRFNERYIEQMYFPL